MDKINIDSLAFIREFSTNPFEWTKATANEPISKLDQFFIQSSQQQLEDVFKILTSDIFPSSLKENDLSSLFTFELIKNGLFFNHTKWEKIYKEASFSDVKNKDEYAFEFAKDYPYKDQHNFKHLFSIYKDQFYQSLQKDEYKNIHVMRINPFQEELRTINFIAEAWDKYPDTIPKFIWSLDSFLYEQRDEDFFYPWSYVFPTITNLKDFSKIIEVLDKIQAKYPFNKFDYDKSNKIGAELEILPWRMALHFMYEVADINDFDYLPSQEVMAFPNNKEFFEPSVLKTIVDKSIIEKNFDDDSWESDTLNSDDEIEFPIQYALCTFKIFAEHYFQKNPDIKSDLKIGKYHKEFFWHHSIGYDHSQSIITDLFQKRYFVKALNIDWKNETELPEALINYPGNMLSILHPAWEVADGVNSEILMQAVKNIFEDIYKKNPELYMKSVNEIKESIDRTVSRTAYDDQGYINSADEELKQYFDSLSSLMENQAIRKQIEPNQNKKKTIVF